MKTVELNVPDEVYRKLEEFVRAVEDFSKLESRAKRGDWDKFDRAMAKVRDVPPLPGDEQI